MSSTRQLPLPFPTSILNIPCDREKVILGKMGDGVKQSARMLLQDRRRHHAFRWFPYGFPIDTALNLTGPFAVAVGDDPEACKFSPASSGNEPEKNLDSASTVTLFHARREDRDASPTSVTGSTTFTPVEVERIWIGARARGDRVKVINGHVTAHTVVHSDRTEEVGLPLQYP